jgi:hypothetical protein
MYIVGIVEIHDEKMKVALEECACGIRIVRVCGRVYLDPDGVVRGFGSVKGRDGYRS